MAIEYENIEDVIELLTWVKYLLTDNINNEPVTPNSDPSGTDQVISGAIDTLDSAMKKLTTMRDNLKEA